MTFNRPLPDRRGSTPPPPREVYPPQPTPTDTGAVFVEGVPVREIFGVLRRSLWLLLLLPVAGLVFAYFWLPKPTARYTANAAIQILNVRRGVAAGFEDLGTDRLGRFVDPVQSHIELLRGREVVGRVVDRESLRLISVTDGFTVERLRDMAVAPDAPSDSLHLVFMPEEVSVVSSAGTATAPYGTPVELGGVKFTISAPPAELPDATLRVVSRDMAVTMVAAGISAAPRKETDIVDVYYTSAEPRRARRIVNALVEAHRDWSIDMAQDRSRRRRVFLEEQLRSAETRLAEAQLDLSTLRSSRQIYSSRDRLTNEQQSLSDLRVRIEEMNAERRLYQALLRDLQTPGDPERSRLRALVSAPGMGNNPVISQLYTQLVRYEMSRDSMMTGSIGHTANHPSVERLNSLISSTQHTIVDAAQTNMRLLDERINALEGFRARSAADLRVLPQTEAEEMRLQYRVESIRVVSDQLRIELQRAAMAEAVDAGQVEIAYLAPLPAPSFATRRRNRTIMLAGVLGMMLGVAGAFGREMMNTSIRRRNDIEKFLQVQELAIIPKIEERNGGGLRKLLPGRNGTNGRGRHGLMTASAVQSASAEAYRTLRTNLTFSPLAGNARSLVITSASPLEGKSTTAVNLAYVLAQQGRRVLLVDADLRRPRLHELLHTSREPGLTSVLNGRATAQLAAHATAVQGLWLMPCGPAAANPAELLDSDRMRQLLASLTEEFDIVVFDSPPLLATSDAAILAAEVDGTIMVVHAGRTHRNAAQLAMQQLEAVGATVAGAVLNDPDGEAPRHGDYYYSYGYYAEAARDGTS